MHVYKTKAFGRFQRKERIADAALRDAVDRVAKGLIDADLGGGIVKQRVARPGQGRSGGYRTIIAFRTSGRAVFLFGFAKNSQSSIDDATLAMWQLIGADLLTASNKTITKAIADGELIEVSDA
jgi:hypothetical protein